MKENNFDQVSELIERIADSYNLPAAEQVSQMCTLTGKEWDAEDLQMLCCEYWSHHSLEETIYMMFHSNYPPVSEITLAFWKYKAGVLLDDEAVFEKICHGGKMKALEALPLTEIIEAIKDALPTWQEEKSLREDNWCYYFDHPNQDEYWKRSHFMVTFYGLDANQSQLIRFFCHNIEAEHIQTIINSIEMLGYPLHIRKETDI